MSGSMLANGRNLKLHQKKSSIKNILIIGYGAAGRKHYQILNKLYNKKNIYIFSNHKIKNKNTLKKLSEILNLNPDYIVLANQTKKHYIFFKFIEKHFSNKKILIEKPLFHKPFKVGKIKNYYYIGYNLRFCKIVDVLKQKYLKEKYFFSKIFCSSFLPNWRKNIQYHKSNSSDLEGGGVLNELSHEIDLIYFLFKKFKIVKSLSTKISKLQISSDDYLNLDLCDNFKNLIN